MRNDRILFVPLQSNRRSRLFYRIGCIAFIWMMLLASWEYDRAQIALANGDIPEEAIRLRILAHSDAPADQWLKNQVRDAIIAYVENDHLQAGDIEAARAQIAAHLPELTQLVGDVLASYGYEYDYTVELGATDFPAKMYGRQIYPAGTYEALKITIGNGHGRNWWCVLFPPLCFVDVVSGRAEAEVDGNEQTVADVSAELVSEKEKERSIDDAKTADEMEDGATFEMRFFVWDWLKKWFSGA